MSRPESDSGIEACWRIKGSQGDRSCDQLITQVLCRNCPTYRSVGRTLFDRPLEGDYRQEITQRLAEPPRRALGETLRLLVFRVGGLWLALPSALFEGSSQVVEICPVPGRSKPHFLGLAHVSGELKLCFSLASLFEGNEAIPPGSGEPLVHAFPRLLELKTHEGRWLFRVDEVLQALDCALDRLEQPPLHLRKENQGLIRALLSEENRLIHLLDEARLTAIWGGALS